VPPAGKATGKPRRKTATGAGTLCAFTHCVLDRLNSLLRVELAAVAGYQKALRVLKRKAVADSDQILQLAADHQRTVTALHGSVQARGGAPVVAADPWEGSIAAALTAEGASAMLESKDFVGALLEVERRGLAEYEAALSSLDDDARELVELELIPRQRRHVAQLSAMLVHLAA
jgi:bacterioferritin (cytochrome b1)